MILTIAPPEPTFTTVYSFDVDKLQDITQDDMTGVMYNGVFYVEWNSFKSKYLTQLSFFENNGVFTVVSPTSKNFCFQRKCNRLS